MPKTINITFDGGFHSYHDVTIRATVRDCGTYLGAFISRGQARKLGRIFCGVGGCLCGGVYRSQKSAPDGWTLTAEGDQDGGIIAYCMLNSHTPNV